MTPPPLLTSAESSKCPTLVSKTAPPSWCNFLINTFWLTNLIFEMADTPRTILIIERDRATSVMYARALREVYHVIVATDETDIDVLLTGHTLLAAVLEPGPVGGRGWELLTELKRRPDTRSVPVIICTAQDERRRGLEMGAAAYLTKPVLPAALLEMVRRLTSTLSPEGELT